MDDDEFGLKFAKVLLLLWTMPLSVALSVPFLVCLEYVEVYLGRFHVFAKLFCVRGPKREFKSLREDGGKEKREKKDEDVTNRERRENVTNEFVMERITRLYRYYIHIRKQVRTFKQSATIL